MEDIHVDLFIRLKSISTIKYYIENPTKIYNSYYPNYENETSAYNYYFKTANQIYNNQSQYAYEDNTLNKLKFHVRIFSK